MRSSSLLTPEQLGNGVRGPVDLSSDQDDFALPWAYSTHSIMPTGPVTLTGLKNYWPGRRVTIVNSGNSDTLTLANQSASSTPAYRIICPGSADFELPPNATADLIYDSEAQRWRVLEPEPVSLYGAGTSFPTSGLFTGLQFYRTDWSSWATYQATLGGWLADRTMTFLWGWNGVPSSGTYLRGAGDAPHGGSKNGYALGSGDYMLIDWGGAWDGVGTIAFYIRRETASVEIFNTNTVERFVEENVLTTITGGAEIQSNVLWFGSGPKDPSIWAMLARFEAT